MKRNLLRHLIGILLGMTTTMSYAAKLQEFTESIDSVRIMQIIEQISVLAKNQGTRIAAAAEALDGAENLDPLSFINLSMGIAKASLSPSQSWLDFRKSYENVSRRKGIDDGFTSILLYGADWIVDNVYRGNIKELTEAYSGGATAKIKSLDYISRNPDVYVALKDSNEMKRMKKIEMGFRSLRIPHLKKEFINKSNVLEDMRSGDIVMTLGSEENKDFVNIGIVTIKEDKPHLVWISRQDNKVSVTPLPIDKTLKKEGQYFYGWRWLRPQ